MLFVNILLSDVLCVNVLFMVIVLEKKVDEYSIKICHATYRGGLQMQPTFLM